MTTDAHPNRTQKVHVTEEQRVLGREQRALEKEQRTLQKEEEALRDEKREQLLARIDSVVTRLHPPSASLSQTVPTHDPRACPEADVMARTLIASGVFDEEAFKKRIGKGLNDTEHHFACHFAAGVAEYAVDAIVRAGPSVRDTIVTQFKEKVFMPDPENVFDGAVARFAKGVLQLPQDTYTFALAALAKQLASKSELAVKQASGYRVCTEALVRIGQILRQDENFSQEGHRALTVHCLSNVAYVEPKAPREQECSTPRRKSSPS